MAVDTAARRYSMINFGIQQSMILFEVEGAVDQDDRYQLLHTYSGFGDTGGAAPVADPRTRWERPMCGLQMGAGRY